MIYKCKYGLYHNKNVIGGEPRSNNGWIYTAYAEKLGLLTGKIDDHKLRTETFKGCVEDLRDGLIVINRLPGIKTPPVSHDEILGMYCLGFLSYDYLKSNHFMYKGAGEPLNSNTLKKIIVGITQLAMWTVLLGKHHRNTFWERKIKNLYLAAFRLHPGNIYFLKKCEGIKPHKEECIIWKLYVEQTLKNGSAGEKNLLWLQAKHMRDEGLAERCDQVNNFKKYFGESHPFVTLGA